MKTIRLIGGELWFCCPNCGQKLHQIAPTANCHGVTTYCKRCRKVVQMEISNTKGA